MPGMGGPRAGADPPRPSPHRASRRTRPDPGTPRTAPGTPRPPGPAGTTRRRRRGRAGGGGSRQGRGPHRDRPSSGAEPRAHRGQAPLLKPLHQHPCPAVIPGRGRAPGTGVGGTHGTGPEKAAAWGSPHAQPGRCGRQGALWLECVKGGAPPRAAAASVAAAPFAP